MSKEKRELEVTSMTRTLKHDLDEIIKSIERLRSDYEEIILDSFNVKVINPV